MKVASLHLQGVPQGSRLGSCQAPSQPSHLHLRHGSFNPAEAALLQLGPQAQRHHVDAPELGLRQQTLHDKTKMTAIQAATLVSVVSCFIISCFKSDDVKKTAVLSI